MDSAGVIGTMRAAVSFAERMKNAELLQQLLEAQSGLLETISANLQLQAEATQLRAEIAALKTTMAIKEELQFYHGLYYPKSNFDERGEIKDVNVNPVCQRCLEVDNRVTHVQWVRVLRHYRCAQCEAIYTDHEH